MKRTSPLSAEPELCPDGQPLEAYSAAFDQALIGMVFADVDGRIRKANDAFCRIVGYAEEELVGKDSGWFTHPDDRPRNAVLLHDLIEHQDRGIAFEKRYVRKDGATVWVRASVSTVHDARGNPTSIVGFVDDITARRKAEQELVETRRRLDAALIAGEIGTFEWDVVADRLYGDCNFEALFDIPLDDRRAAPLGDFMNAIHPDDRERVAALIKRSLETGCDYQAEYRITSGRRERWVIARGKVEHDEHGRVVRFPGVLLDNTARTRAENALKESEARFRQLADAMPQIVFAATPDGNVDYFNRQWYEYTGLPEGSIGFESWRHVHTEEGLRRVMEVWPEALRTGKPYEIEYRLRRADGAFRWHLGRALPVRDASGEIVRWFGTNTDIHDQKLLLEQNQQLLDSERAARGEAERASHMKDDFLATLSHEIRTPLNAILGWTQILKSGVTDENDLKEGLDIIDRNARVQIQIIEDLLDMSRIISGKVRLDVRRLDLAAVVRAAIETVRPAADAKGIGIRAALDPLADPISGDPSRLQQVFWNLLSNAIKFTPSGGQVHVRLERVNSHVEVSVIDTGEGIKPEFLPYVFDRFRQADASTTRRHGGLGLGLAIVKNLAELHGGSVRATSPGPLRGTTFTVSLPLVARRQEPDPSEPPPPTREPVDLRLLEDTRARIAGVKILAVDDEPDALSMIRRLLEDCRASVLTASSAEDALPLVESERPDVVISDIGMPGQDGYSLIRRIRQLGAARGGSVPAVALTAYARAEDRVKAILAGFQQHVAKPVEPAELITVVATLAGRTGE